MYTESEGIGEDEKPYNYICNLDKVNLGGPGWFNDVFQVTQLLWWILHVTHRVVWFGNQEELFLARRMFV